ncbi:ATP-binding protein [Paenibacillus sp. IITD108]|uniref:ATP-binding protein n=1 Tax=Paenibacillus sp. IITD108 TaxID=3116649 RepID=UPI002F3EA4D2
MKDIRLQIPCRADYIDIVRVCLYSIASKLSFTYEEIEDMKVAVSEACNNAVLHGSPELADNSIDIRFQPSDTSLTIKVINKGPAFPHDEALVKAAPLQEGSIRDLPVGGLGIFLMQALMDEVAVETKDQTTVVTLMKTKKQTE